MPVAEFPGRHGWGYDGVYLSAAALGLRRRRSGCSGWSTPPTREGLAVLLDVVYNHLGASGVKAMEAFGPYLTDKYATPWGKAVNLDDAGSDPCASGSCSRPSSGSATSTSTACGSTRSTR